MKNERLARLLDSRILPYVSKPGRYLGNELNSIHKDLDDNSIRVALAFPEVYEIAMSYIGFDILYHVLNRQEHIWAERVYAPWADMEELLRKEDIRLFSLESFTSIQEFDLIGFTLQYELTYTNVLNMLDLAGIPVRSRSRLDTDPIIIAGGPCTCNPEPMAEFIDAFLIGDGETAVVDMARTIGRLKKEGHGRKRILEELAGIAGVYVPSLYETQYDADGNFQGIRPVSAHGPERIRSRLLSELKAEHYPEAPLVPLVEVTHDRLAVEVMRGCTEGCRYCNAGMIYRPTRERSTEDIIEQIKTNLDNTGHSEVSFLSLSISDYSRLATLMKDSRQMLNGAGVNVSFPSMRLDKFSPEIAEYTSSVRKSGFTFAPEAGSPRLRRVINKNISDDDLYRSVSIALEKGWKLLKFYFMIGLPTETEDDVLAIAQIMERVVELSRGYGNITFNVSISPFSPKAHTPFQWERQDTKEEFKHKVYLLKERFRKMRRVKLNWRDPDVSKLECVLGRADRRMAEAIYIAWKSGAKFDGWSEFFDMSLWQNAVRQAGLNMDSYSALLDPECSLPWDHIDKGVSKSFLKKERQNAYREILVSDCKTDRCHACGWQRKGGFRELVDCYQRQNDPAAVHPGKETATVASSPERVAQQNRQFSKFRLQFTKTGLAKYLSHLDIVRTLERACRRAGIPLRYSEGFNPHPKLSFGPPLALGCTSDAEFVDVEIDSGYADNLQNALNSVLPDGFKIVRLQQVNLPVKSLGAIIDRAEYEVNLRQKDQLPETLEHELDNLLKRAEIIVERKVKGRLKKIDIRPFIEQVDFADGILRIRTRVLENRTVRIPEILTVLLGQSQGLSIHRKKQLIHDETAEKTPFDVLS